MSELFLKIVNMSIAAGWLIVVVLLLRVVMKKAPKWVNVLLWGFVAIRLICPFSLESGLSLMPSAETIPQKVLSGPSFDVHTGIGVVDQQMNDYLGDHYFEGVTVPAQNGYSITAILSVIWIAGIVLLVLYALGSYWKLRRQVAEAVRYKDNIFQSENVTSPFVLGLFRPRIYLPYYVQGQELLHVIAHERVHIQRKDHWWKPLGYLLLIIYWFHPLMWLSYVLLCRDIELACDEKVIKELKNEQRADYTQALVTCSVHRRMVTACPLAFGEVGVKERVKTVMNYKKPAFWTVAAAVAACVGIAVCFLTNPVGFRFDETKDVIVSAQHFDARTVEDTGTVEMNLAQISELSSRLASLKNTRQSDRYAGLTAGYQISISLQDGSDMRISGYSFSDYDMVDIEWNDKRYVVSNREFQKYVLRICAREDVVDAENAAMIPTNTTLEGFHAGALLLPIDGEIYRYSMVEEEAVTKKQLLYTFVEVAADQKIDWEVYTLKEYPDASKVLLVSKTEGMRLCAYSRPLRCDEFALSDAMAAGYTVMEDGIATHGMDAWKQFYEETQNGKEASIAVAHYYTLDPKFCDATYYEVFAQDYPFMSVSSLSYDGTEYTLVLQEESEQYVEQYQYLMKYDTKETAAVSSKEPEMIHRYILTQDNTLTWAKIMNGIFSSLEGSNVEHYSIYTEKE